MARAQGSSAVQQHAAAGGDGGGAATVARAASVDPGTVLRLQAFNVVNEKPSSVWHELTTSAGTKKAEDVVIFCAAHGIDLLQDKSSHASADGVHAAWVREGDYSAIVFTPPFSLAVVGAVVDGEAVPAA